MIRAVTFTTVANHISTVVSELPNYLSRTRNVSRVGNTRAGTQSGPVSHHGIFNADNSIHIGHNPNWMTMDQGDKNKINDELARLGLGKNKKNKSFSNNSYNTKKNR